jgi:hypothetical protein
MGFAVRLRYSTGRGFGGWRLAWKRRTWPLRAAQAASWAFSRRPRRLRDARAGLRTTRKASPCSLAESHHQGLRGPID